MEEKPLLSKKTKEIGSLGLEHYTDPGKEINVRVLRLWKSYQGWTNDQPELTGIQYDRHVLEQAVREIHDQDRKLQKLSRNSIICMMVMNQSLRAVPLHTFYILAEPNYKK